MKQMLYEIDNSEKLESSLAEIKVAADSYGTSEVFLHYFCGMLCGQGTMDCEAFMEEIRVRTGAVMPGAKLIGLSTYGEINEAKISKPCVLLSAFLFHTSFVKIVLLRDIVSREGEAADQLAREVESCKDVRAVELLLAGGNIKSSPVYEKLKSCQDKLPFFGGYAVEHGSSGELPFVMTNDGIFHNCMAGVFYGGEELHMDVGRTTGWKPLGNNFKVTRAEGRRLYTVNGIPAYDLYDRFLNFPEEESFRIYAMEFPLILRRRRMKLLRHPQEKYEDGSILLDGRVEENEEICLSYGSPVEIIQRINGRCEVIREFEPEAVLIYSCQGRKNYWGDLISWEMEPFQRMAETGGACLEGQIMRNFQTGRVLEHRLTLLSVALREGEKTGRDIPQIAVDEEILKGRMSLVNRMSVLIETAVDELQRTNNALAGMNERLARANEELYRIAITDELTGLYNRREIERRIKNSMEKLKTDKTELTLVMLDIDFFKKVNDTYGHDVGDEVLKEVSAILKDYTDEQSGESAGRWGGEEFLILLPDKGVKEAMELAERIRRTVEQHDFPTAKHLTVSMGVTCANADSNYHAVFINADQALYQAKESGRNQVVGVF